jgi:phytoene synthase
VRFEAECARGLYARARAALAPADRRSMRPAEVMAAVYEAVLAEIEREPEKVLKGRVELGGFRKLAAAISGYFHRGTHAQV